MAQLTEENKVAFLNAAKELQEQAYKMLALYEGPMQEYMDENRTIVEAYPFHESFDEWWHRLSNYTEILEQEFKKLHHTKELTVRGLIDQLNALPHEYLHRKITIYTGSWYRLVDAVDVPDEDGGLAILRMGREFDNLGDL